MPSVSTMPDNPLDRRIAIMNHYESGYFVGAKSAEEIRDELGGTPRSVAAALKELGFTIAQRRSKRKMPTGQGRRTRVVPIPRKWAPPANLEWPEVAKQQRQLRTQGLSVWSVKAAFRSADVPTSVMEQAMARLLLEGKSFKARGAIRKAVNAVIAERDAVIAAAQAQQEYERDHNRDPELAKIIGLSPDAPRMALLRHTDNLVRALARNSGTNRNA